LVFCRGGNFCRYADFNEATFYKYESSVAEWKQLKHHEPMCLNVKIWTTEVSPDNSCGRTLSAIDKLKHGIHNAF